MSTQIILAYENSKRNFVTLSDNTEWTAKRRLAGALKDEGAV